MIDHDPEAYGRWREAQASRVAAAQPQEGQERLAASRAGEAFSWRGTGTGTDTGGHGRAGGEASYDHDPVVADTFCEDELQYDGQAWGGARGLMGGSGGGGGGDEGLQPWQARVGVFDRLGLVSFCAMHPPRLRFYALPLLTSAGSMSVPSSAEL